MHNFTKILFLLIFGLAWSNIHAQCDCPAGTTETIQWNSGSATISHAMSPDPISTGDVVCIKYTGTGVGVLTGVFGFDGGELHFCAPNGSIQVDATIDDQWGVSPDGKMVNSSTLNFNVDGEQFKGMTFENYGTVTTKNISLNKNGSVGKIINYGDFIIDGNFALSSEGDLENHGYFEVTGGLGSGANSILSNQTGGEIYVVGNFERASGTTNNYGTFRTDGELRLGGNGTLDLEGGLFYSRDLVFTSGTYQAIAKCALFNVTNTTTINCGNTYIGEINIVDAVPNDGTDMVCGSEQNVDFTYTDGSSLSDCAVALPVELIYFSAKESNDGSVVLNWKTASERNNSHFAVEYSTNGKDFETLTIVDGAGSTAQEQVYQWVDQSKRRGTIYYRLRQVDYNGQYSLSPVASVKRDLSNQVSLYPNPLTTEELTIHIPSMEGAFSYQIISLVGEEILAGEMSLERGQEEIQITLGQLEQGIFMIRLNLPNGIVTKTFTIAR